MDLIHYSGGELLTGSKIADAVVRYAEALALHQRAAAIQIPIRSTNGSTQATASLLLGPASQITTMVAESAGEELHDDGVVAEIERRIAELDPTPMTAEEAMLKDDSQIVASDWTDEL